MIDHPPETLLRAYVRNELRGDELLRIDDHLAACIECRAVLGILPASARRAWEASLTGEHIAYDRLEAYVDGTLVAGESGDVDAHRALCGRCAAEIADLQQFRRHDRGLEVRRWMAGAAAAVAVIVISIVLWSARRPEERPVVTAAGSHSAAIPPPAPAGSIIRDARTSFALAPNGMVNGLPPRAAETLRQLRAGIVAGAAIFSDVQVGRDALRGPGRPAGDLRVEQPLGFVLDDRPEFRWSDRAGGVYVVEVFDRSYHLAARSGELTTTTWRPAAPLPRAQTYEWQVRRRRGKEEASAPAPPAAPARLHVVSREGVEEIRKGQAEGSHLLAALAYAREGMIADAKREADALGALNPASPLIEQLRTTLSNSAASPMRHQPLATTTNADQ